MPESGGSVERTLILCIDGDNDIGQKSLAETPILSRNANLEAATNLALADPEEADANAMFGAVRLYDQLIIKYPDEVYQVATIAGTSMGGVESDRKIVRELESVLEYFKADGVILVTDGYSDEEVIPLIHSRVPITSIQHVVVKHSERIEETWAVLFRYMRMLVEDPYYSRMSLGVPGIMLVILGFLTIFGQLKNAGMVLTFFLGIILLVKGFGFDEKLAVARLKLPSPDRQLTLASLSVGVIVSIVGVINGVVYSWRFVPPSAPPMWENYPWWIQQSPLLLGHFIIGAIDFIILGVMVTLIGGVASYYVQKDSKLLQNIVGIIVTFWLWFIVKESAEILIKPEKTLNLSSPLVIMTLAGVVTTIMSVFYIYGSYKERLSFK